ncbi:MAG: isoprenylcysteine carboxylmethyltransferase family protein [Actinomycetota bacterium]
MGIGRQLRAIVLLPGMAAVGVPALLVVMSGADPGWGLPAPAAIALGIAGAALILVGLRLWAETVRLFAAVGKGTLAPWDPTRKLVVQGPYRRVRNPMISAVAFVLLGEAAILGSPPLLVWLAAFVLVICIYIPLVEEPGLVKRFGAKYDDYRRAVPRWIPRRRPWVEGV